MSAGPRCVLHQLNVAAAPTHNLGHQDVGSGAADASVMTLQMLTYLHTHRIYTHEVIFSHTHIHTLTQSVAAFQCVGSPSQAVIGHCGVRQTNSHSERTLLSLSCFGSIFKSVCCCIDVLFYQSLFVTAGCRGRISLSVPKFSTTNFSCCFNRWVKRIV